MIICQCENVELQEIMKRNILFRILFSVLLFALPTVLAENKFSPQVALHERIGGKGMAVKLIAKNLPDLSAVGFDNKAKSACLRGAWLFYGAKNYTNVSDSVSYRFRKDDSCFNFEMLYEKVSSVRFAGSPTDYRQDVLDLFSGGLFTNVHLRTSMDISDLNTTKLPNVKSLIVSGSSKWTLYDQSEYQGKTKCVSPAALNAPQFYKSKSDIGFGNAEIMSVKKGCK